MAEHEPVNLIRVFDFYLALMLVVGLVRRWEVYVDAVRVLVAVRGRWPRLMRRLADHHSLLLNREFFRPLAATVVLTAVQMVSSRLIWPQAALTGPDLLVPWWRLAAVVVPLVPMLAVDLYFVVRVARFDHAEAVKYMDQAETWLGWRGPVVRVLTLGYVHPHQMVDDEVKKSLEGFAPTVRSSLWWVSAQIALRVLFGLTLWTVWAVGP